MKNSNLVATTIQEDPQPEAADLAAGVESALEEHLGQRPRIRHLACRPSLYRSSFMIEDIDVELEDGSMFELVAKPTAWSAMCPEARTAKPAFIYDEEREFTVYEQTLRALDIGAARYFGSFTTSTCGRVLLLERSDGTPLWQIGEFEAWREAARWLARFHTGARRGSVPLRSAPRHLLQYDREFYQCWMARALDFGTGRHDRLEQLADKYASVVEWLMAQPREFIHGEYYSGNILVERRPEVPFEIRTVDWEMAAVAPALIDLANLLCGNWTDDERVDMADTYFATIAEYGGAVPERDLYQKTLDCCLIHLAVKNLGWSRTWTPPARCAHDWLGEALRLCEKWRL